MATEEELAEWLAAQQRAYDAGELTDEQVALLDSGLPGWNSPEARWNAGTDQAPADADDQTMGAWLAGMHRRYDDRRLSGWTHRRLDEVMPSWNDDLSRDIARRLTSN